MIPPAFTEVWQNVLHRKLNSFVKNLPKMENVGVSNDEGGQEPINTVHNVVMVEVIPNVGPLEFAVVIVGVHLLGHWLIQAGVKVAEKSAPLFSSLLKQKNAPALVPNRHCEYHPLKLLHSRTQAIHAVRLHK